MKVAVTEQGRELESPVDPRFGRAKYLLVVNRVVKIQSGTHENKETLTMPGGDRTGPTRRGPMTGRGAGYCSEAGVPGFMNQGAGGRRLRGRRGGGRGGGCGPFVSGLSGGQCAAMAQPTAEAAPAQFPPEQRLEVLEQQMDNVSTLLEDIRRQIEEIKATKTET